MAESEGMESIVDAGTPSRLNEATSLIARAVTSILPLDQAFACRVQAPAYSCRRLARTVVALARGRRFLRFGQLL